MTIELAAAQTPALLTQANTYSAPSLRLQAAETEYKEFCAKYRLVPGTATEFNEMLSGELKDKKVLVKEPVQADNVTLQSMPFWYIPNEVDKPNKPQRVFTDVLKGVGVLEIYMPGPETPVCTSMHFPSLLNDNILRGLKAAGIDAIVIIVPGPTDAACFWARRLLYRSGFLNLMPQTLPENDLDARLILHPDYPRIIVQADPGLEKINSMGLVNTNENAGRLGLYSDRAFAIYASDGRLLELVKAETPAADKCTAVMGPAILEHAQRLSADLRPANCSTASMRL